MQNSSRDSPKKFCDYNLKSSITTETELEICGFYGKILKEMLLENCEVKFSELRKSLLNIRSYKNPEVDEHDIVSYDEKADRLAYIFAYSVLHTVVMHDRFHSMLKVNPTISEKIILMSKVRLCILGGGPGFEAVALCKLFSSLRERKSSVKQSRLRVYITLVDLCKGWKDDAEMIATSAQEHLCSSGNVEVDFNFLEADLTMGISEDVNEALKKAHIVTMFKCLSDINDSSYSESEIPKMICKIVNCMSFKACLFLLDTAGGNIFNKTDKLIDNLHDTSRIYGPCLHSCHMLSIDSIQNFSEATSFLFRYLKCTARTTISCSAWLNVQRIIKVDEIVYDTLNRSISDPLNTLKTKGRKVKVKKVYQSTSKLLK